MHSRLFSRVTRIAVAALVLLAVGAQTAAARPEPGARRSRGFDLFSGPFQYFLVNRVYCGINALGEFCVDPTNSSTIAGGYWPRGAPNPYIFNSGLQLAGVVASDAGFAWAGDTVGAYFFDARGDQAVGEAIINLHSSLDATDVANWPSAARVRDTSIYDAALVYDRNGVPLNRPAVSQQDIWGRSWDGNVNLGAGREHPMGILTDTRAMAWSFPSGNEDILYFVFDFYNITASDPAVYSGLGELADEVAAIGAQFQANSEQAYGVDIPAGGYTIQDAYAAFAMDPDVDNAGANNSTAVLPFSLATAYKTNWVSEEGFAYPPDVHGPPFANAPGMVGVKYLKSPKDPDTGIEFGLAMFSNTLNSATGFPDPTGVQQLWRYLSGRVSTAAGDNSCNVPNPIQARLCYLDQTPQDTRFYLSSGPFDLVPGQKFTIVVAYVHAAVPAYAITIGTNMPPGIPPSVEDLATGAATERPIDRAAGWVSHSDVNGNGRLEQYEVETFPRSLLNKSLVAQEVFDKKFLLPAPPDAPNFFLVPGNNQVTVVWEPSATETSGDPFYGIAGDPTSALFDPNFRQYDVEGYRIYRGRSQSDLTLIAEFDYDVTYFRDYTGGVVAGGNCAPELDIYDDCLEDFDFPISNTGPYHDFDLVGDLIQVPAGGRVELADGSVLILKADTAGATNVATPHISLDNTGVPFAYVDRAVLNSLTYVYAVTAFDVNAVNSGPTSLESAQILQSVVPRGAAPGQYADGVLGEQVLLGGDGTELDPNAPLPTIDPTTAIFSGPMPPTNGINVGLAAFVSEVLPAAGGAITVTIDSIKPGAGNIGTLVERPVTYHMTVQGSGDPVQIALGFVQDAFDVEHSGTVNFPATNVDSARAALYGGNPSAFLAGSIGITIPGDYQLTTFGRAAANQAPAGAAEHSGPRWWSGSENENTPTPNAGVCTPWSGSCGSASVPVPDITLSAGRLPGVDTLFYPSGYLTTASRPARDFDAILSGVVRAADFKVYWGANGLVDSVIDVVHRLPVPFRPDIGPSWGILNASGFASVNQSIADDRRNDVLTWVDPICVAPGPQYMQGSGTRSCGGAAQTPAVLSQTAELSLIAPRSSANSQAAVAALANSVVSTRGFIFYLNGHFFLMAMQALPAAGTVWNARFFAGNVSGPAVETEYSFIPSTTRPPAVPGLRVAVEYTGAQLDYTATTDSLLERVHTVPDPYYVTNNMEITTNRKVLKFVNLPAQAIIRIYSLSGVLVNVVEHFDPTGGGEAIWDVRNRNNQFVASGVYFYHVETPDGKQRVGRFTVVNFAQ